MQQKQLNKQFCNVSPIDQNLSSYMNNIRAQSFSATISFEQSLRAAHKECGAPDSEDDEARADELDTCSKQSSLILLSPNKLYNEKAGSLIHGLLDDADDEEATSASSLIESQLNVPFSFNAMAHQVRSLAATKSGDSSATDVRKDSSLKTISSESESRLSSLLDEGDNQNNKRSNPNMLTCVTSLFSTSASSGRSTDSSKKSLSLLSFEQHETSSNQARPKASCSNAHDVSTSILSESSSVSKLLSSVRSKIEKSKLESDQDKTRHPIFNSTPLLGVRKQALEGASRRESSDEKFQSYLENGDISSNSTMGGLSKDMKNFNRDYIDNEDDTECDNLDSHEITNLVSYEK